MQRGTEVVAERNKGRKARRDSTQFGGDGGLVAAGSESNQGRSSPQAVLLDSTTLGNF